MNIKKSQAKETAEKKRKIAAAREFYTEYAKERAERIATRDAGIEPVVIDGKLWLVAADLRFANLNLKPTVKRIKKKK